MPLPASSPATVWPPANMQPIFQKMVEWSAWFSGDVEKLQAAYGAADSADQTGFFASDTGGQKPNVVSRVIRWFVGTAPSPTQKNSKTIPPIAAEICQASADLLFSDPVTVTVGKPDKGVDAAKDGPAAPNPTQERLDVLLNDYFHSTMAEAAELGAALGGVYLRVTWDDQVNPDGPFSTIMDADEAIPEFRWGKLVAVTFWSVVLRKGKAVFRHLERHEINAAGNGVILHGLYMGEDDKLGNLVPLATLPETAAMALHVDVDGVEGTIDTVSPGLAVTYIPNQTPNRSWRKHIVGKNLGRSDLDGIEPLMDQLAETMSDWMRARRAARAKVMYAKGLAKSLGPGAGSFIDVDQEVYTEVSYSAGSGGLDNSLADQVQVLQPEFHPEEFKVTADALLEQILQMAGYSMSTFGVQPEQGSGEKTATEIESKERRSFMTRGRKIREWVPGVGEHITKLLLVDNVFFGGQNTVDEITVEFSDGVQESQQKLGLFVQTLYASESASVEERVEVLHPDWTPEQKKTEVDRIKEEFNHTVADPMMDPFDQQTDNTDESAAK